MTSDSAKICCADLTIAQAAERLAEGEGISPEEALLRIIASPVYDAVYALDTGMWHASPELLLELLRVYPG